MTTYETYLYLIMVKREVRARGFCERLMMLKYLSFTIVVLTLG